MTSDTAGDVEKDGKLPAKDKGEKAKGPGVANYWRILSFGTRVEHILFVVALCSAAGSGVALPLMNIIFGNLTGEFNNFSVTPDGSPADAFRESVSRLALFFVYLFIGKFVLTYISMFCFRTVGLRISAALRLAYLRALFAQPVKKLDEVSLGSVASTITSSANDIQASISTRLSGLFQSLALVIAAYGIAFKYSWALTLTVSSGIVFVIIATSLTTPSTLKALQRVQKADEQHATVSSEALSSVRTVFALGAEPKIIQWHSEGVQASHDNSMKVARRLAIQLTPFFFSTYASYALAFWFGLKLYRDGNIDSVTNVIVVFFSVLLVTTVMGQIAQPIVDINKAIVSSTGFFDMMDSDQVRTEGLKEPDVSAHKDIRLENVNFAYPARPGVQILHDFSVTIPRGKTTALVGPSGSGKSTIIGLLERWYNLNDGIDSKAANLSDSKSEKKDAQCDDKKLPPEGIAKIGGSITIGGYNIDDLDLRWWRSQIGLVQQEPFLFNDTILSNVANGLVGTEWEDVGEDKKLELVKEACVEAVADEFISKLPNAYSSRVGEGGIKLSGGQRQRIAIARSIVRKPAILILDEATSAIDVHGEKLVQEALDRAAKDRTTIMVAHRLSTVRKADNIVVLRNGHKIEEGTHEGLLQNENGLYSGLVRAQAIMEEKSSVTSTEDDFEDIIAQPTLTHTSTRHSLAVSDVDVENGDGNPIASNSTYKNRGIFGSVGLFLYEQRSRWILYAAIILAAMGCGAAYALQSWFFAQLVQTFQFVGQRLVDAANFWSLMFFVLALCVTTCYAVLSFGAGVVSTYVGTSCRRDYFSNALKMPIKYFDREENASGSIMQRLSSDPKQIQDLLGVNSAFPLIAIFNIVGSVIISFYFGWKLTLVTFFAVMPVILGASFLRMRHEVQFELKNSQVFATSSQFATEATGAFRTVSALGMEEVVLKRYNKLLSEQIASSTRKASYAMLIYALSDSIEFCGMALAFWYGGQLLASREYNAFQFFVVYAAIIQGSQAAGQYLSIIPNIANATSAANRIIRLRSEVDDEDRSQGHTKISTTASGAKISFKDITFRYPGTTTPLFSHLNVNIEAGQYVAFVGPSGCGKTSMISMLERFYNPIDGSIYVDGEDVASLDTRAYRGKLALVSQEPRLFSGTIRKNLLLGVDETSVTEDYITQACRDAEIHDFIISLPEGYETELGQNTQTALSGGQKQRLCLARALLRKPKLLLLDEATSSLDSQSEKLVQGAIERLAGQRNMTVIAVAHRLATIQKADVIFVFGERDTESRKGSRIVETGSHSDLLSKRGVYWSMCKAQALDQ